MIGNVRDFAVSDTNLFAGTGDDGVIRTSDNGVTWSNVNNDITDINILSLAAGLNGSGGMNIFAGTLFGGVYLSTNNGTNWKPVGLSDVQALEVNSVTDSTINVFAGTGNGVFRSTDNGTDWISINNGFDPDYACNAVNDFAAYGTSIYAATGFGVFVSTNHGTSWSAINNGLTNTNVRAIAVSRSRDDTILLAGTFTGGVFRSTNNGISWSPANIGLASKVIYRFAIIDDDQGKSNIFAGISGGSGVYLSTNFGTTWTAVDSGLATKFEPSIFALAICGGYLFIGTDDGVWRRPLDEMITSIKVLPNNIPSNFVLYQNYPNPFNPTTNIKFEISAKCLTSLRIYDVLGREITTLVNDVLQPGKYERIFNGAGLASGIYFYRLQITNDSYETIKFSQTKKLIIQK